MWSINHFLIWLHTIRCVTIRKKISRSYHERTKDNQYYIEYFIQEKWNMTVGKGKSDSYLRNNFWTNWPREAVSCIFDLLWYGQLPCTDVKGLTSEIKDELSFSKKCYGKGKELSCNSIFQKRPTDKGMCCSFNMATAEKIFKSNRYTKAISRRQASDSKSGFNDF